MSWIHRGVRIGLLMLGTVALLNWTSHHSEVVTASGLRCVVQAQRIERGDFSGGLIGSIDHPLHPLVIAAVHKVLGGQDWPYAWQTAAQAASVLVLVLTVVPIYLIGRELFDDATAGLACVLVFANPAVCSVAVNVLSESTFLLVWSWGLWGAFRFLREGRFVWLPPTIGFGALAYLTRPEGVLLHLGLVVTLALLPMHALTRVYWPRWWAAVAFLVLGPALLIGPYIAAKGGLGTKPAVARLIGSAPQASSTALERESPLVPGQPVAQTYALAVVGTFHAIRGILSLPLLALAVLGLVVWRPSERARLWQLTMVVLVLSLAGLVRLHATAGYCSERHALIPGVLLLLTASHGVVWLIRTVAVDGKKLGLGEGKLRPGPGIWGALIATLVVLPIYRSTLSFNSSFAVYRQAGGYIAIHPELDAHVLDLTDWSLFFSDRRGLPYAKLVEAGGKPEARFVLVRDVQLKGRGYSGEVIRGLLGAHEVIARFPERVEPGQEQILVYDMTRPYPEEVARRGDVGLGGNATGNRQR